MVSTTETKPARQDVGPSERRRAAGGFMRRSWPVGIALFLGLPLLAILAEAASAPSPLWSHIASTFLGETIANSLILLAGGLLLGASFGATTAWLIAAFEFPFRRSLEIGLVLPLAVPTYLIGYVATWLFDVAGPVQSGLRASLGLVYGEYWFPEIRTVWGAGLVMGLVLYPYPYLLCRAAFLQRSAAQLEAARILGSSPLASFLRIALPLARPALASGLALVGMEILADFGTVHHFGVRTFTTTIYDAWFGFHDRIAAAQLSVGLVAAILLLRAAERLGRASRGYSMESREDVEPARIRLRGWAALGATAVCLAPCLLGFGMPAGSLIFLAIQHGDPLLGPSFLPYAWNSVQVAVLTAALATFFALLFTHQLRIRPSRGARILVRLASLGYAVPGSVLAIGVLAVLGWLDRILDAASRAALGVRLDLLLSGSLVALVYACVVRFQAVGLAALESGSARLSLSMEEAARIAGARPARVLRDIQTPLLARSLLTASLLVFVDAMKELPATLIIRPFDFDTLAVRVFNLASDERLSQASTAALAIVLVGLLPVSVLLRSSGQDRSIAKD